ncbi:MAG: SUF system NifU family Fe-S cluster assembly protein [Candidatus Moraniibacteriota bacterium]
MSIYQQLILDHYRNPRNQGILKMPTHEATGSNPTCGDKLSMHLLVKNDIIEGVKFTGSGCAISQASASILTEYLSGRSAMEMQKLSREDLLELLGIEFSLTREKCALLALETFKKAIK